MSKLKFDPSGKYLVDMDHDARNRMVLYDWENEVVRAATETDERQTMEVEFERKGRGIIQCRMEALCFWMIQGSNLNFKHAYFGDKGKVSSGLIEEKNALTVVSYSCSHFLPLGGWEIIAWWEEQTVVCMASWAASWKRK